MNQSFLRILARWWWVPALMLGVSVVAGLWWTSRQPHVYRASALLAVIPNSSVQADADVLRSLDVLERRTLLATFAQLPGTREMRTAVAKAMDRDPSRLTAYRIGAAVLPNTNIIRINVDGPDPALAARMATAAGELAAVEARSLYRIYTMRPVAAAEASTRPIHPDQRRNSLAAGVVGLFIGTLAVGVIGVRGRGAR
jgi:capsular polysaccharide biosynthesis protein